jgi:hypothetical protein
MARRAAWIALAGWLGITGWAVGDEPLQYNRDIRPILAETCFACHGPDSASRQADLRIDQREAAIELGAIEPGKPDESEMIRRIFSDDPDERMPPAESQKKLTDAQKEVLRRWIREGAAYQPHWSFIPPQPITPPTVRQADWVRNPIDNFILAALEQRGLQPAPEADRYTLARRLSLDLTGLPPAPELVDEFVHDESPNAYEKLVDELLRSPQWGEHRARYWLDYARYADTHGLHFDNYREMWSYRDWVIRAFNANMPYDQFTVESLAGDLLPNRTLEQQIGSGFNRCNMTTNEGGIIDEEYLVLYTRDRTETTSRIWMGLTANCAVCHDHKFDPLSQQEFYELAAFFNNTTQGARDGNIKDTPPIITVPQPQDRDRWYALEQEIPAMQTARQQRQDAALADFQSWLAAATADVFSEHLPRQDLQLAARLDEGSGPTVKVLVGQESRDVPLGQGAAWEAGHIAPHALQVSQAPVCEIADAGDFDVEQPFSCAAWIKLPANDSYGAIVSRMDNDQDFRGWDMWVESRRVGMHIVHKWNDDALKVVSQDQIPANRWTHVLVTYDGSKKAAGVKVYIDGELKKTNVQADSLRSTTRTKVPLKIGQRNTSEVLSGLALQDLRIYARLLTPADAETLARATRYASLLAKAADQRTADETQELFGWWLVTLDTPYRQLSGKLAELEREQSDLRARGTIAHVMQEKSEEAMAFILFRGEYDKRRDSVKADTPQVLPQFPDDFSRDRLGFAQWLLLPDHPLTARVTVNRYWQEVFGTGLVRTSDDFGVTGELPSHPELLDWLAIDFRDSGWNVQRLFKLMVMSASYRQSAAVTPEKIDKDRDNRWLSRGPRFRMDAEMIRDYAIAASGLLVRQIGGPSVKPYQPPGVWEAIAMNVSNTRSYEPDNGENLYRRSMYTFWKRMAPPASMEIFNAPNREFCVVRRERTNTPLQALVTLNDEQFVEAARRTAELALSQGGDAFDTRLQFMARRLLCRPLREEEVPVARQSFDALQNWYREHADDAGLLVNVGASKPDKSLDVRELAAWTMLANQLLNLDEVLNK